MEPDQRTHPNGTRKDRSAEPWHYDVRIPAALIFAILLQTAGIVWWAAGEDAKNKDAIRRIELIEAFDLNVDGKISTVGEKLSALQERTTDQLHTLERIEDILRERHPK